MKRVMTSLSSIAVLTLAACSGSGPSGGGDSDMSEDEAERAFDATANTTSGAAESAQNSAAFTTAFDQLAQEVDIDFDHQCTGGGSATLEGSMTMPDDGGANDTEMNMSVSYQGCTEDGVTIDGSLDYWYASSSDDSGTTTLSTTMNGQVDFSGDVEGSCGIDVAIDITMDIDFESGNFDIQVDATGNFCGYDLEELDTDMTDPGNYEGA